MRLAIAWFVLWALRLHPEWQVRLRRKGARAVRSKTYGSGRKFGAGRRFLEIARRQARWDLLSEQADDAGGVDFVVKITRDETTTSEHR